MKKPDSQLKGLQTSPGSADARRLVFCDFCLDGSGGLGWTERSEGSSGVSGYRPPTPATRRLRFDRALGPKQATFGVR